MEDLIFQNLAKLNPDKITKTQIKINNITYSKRNLPDLKPVLAEKLKEKDQLELYKIPDTQFKELVVDLLPDLKEYLAEDSGGGEDLSDKFEIFSVVDSSKNDDYVVFDREANSFHTTTYQHLKRAFPKRLSKTDVKTCKVVYDPMVKDNENKIMDIDGQEDIKAINLYEIPSWRERFYSSPDAHEKTELPELAREFFEHLFPSKESRHYVYHWLYHALTKRNGNIQILVLQGPQGIGKNFFVDEIVKGLFGRTNGAFYKAPESIFGRFNAGLINRRLISVDEAKVTHSTYENLKKLTNNTATFEKKFVDADKEFEIFFSLIATMNTSTNWYIHHDDRRSSIVDITNERLDAIWDEETMADFYELLQDDEFIEEIGSYILNRAWVGEDDEKQTPPLFQFRSKKFYQFVFDHLSSWEQTLLEYVLKKGKDGEEVVSLNSFITKLEADGRRKFVPKLKTVEGFILSYKHRGKDYLGTIADDEDNLAGLRRVLKINPIFVEEVSEDEEEDLL